MATTKHTLTISTKGANARFVIVYRAGKFHRLERKSGKLATDNQWSQLMHLVPEKESNIEHLAKEFKGRVEYTLVTDEKPQSLFKLMMDEYVAFYEQKTELKPLLNGTSGKALKMIITALKKTCADDQEVIAVWQTILANWNKLDEFYAQQLELRQINSNLNTILRQVKNGNGDNEARTTAKRNADGLRKGL